MYKYVQYGLYLPDMELIIQQYVIRQLPLEGL